jgi:hypothetical protein
MRPVSRWSGQLTTTPQTCDGRNASCKQRSIDRVIGKQKLNVVNDWDAAHSILESIQLARRSSLVDFTHTHTLQAYLVFLDNVRESLEAFSIDGTRNGILLAIPLAVVLEPQGFQFQTGNPEGWVGRDGNSHPVPVKVESQDGVAGLFPVQDGGNLGRLAQLSRQLEMHCFLLQTKRFGQTQTQFEGYLGIFDCSQRKTKGQSPPPSE